MGNKNNFYNMFKTIMWKNYIVRKRHWFVTLLEVTIPCLVFGVMLYIHLKTGNDNSDEPAYHPEPYNDLVECFSKNNYDNYLVAFAPNNTFTNTMMNKTREMIWNAKGQENGHTFFSVAHLLELVPLNYEYEIEHLFQKWDDNDTEGTFYGIVFDNKTDFSSDKLDYKIRVGGLLANFQTDKTFPQFMFPGRGHGGAVYKSTCFLTIQYALDKIFIEAKSKQTLNYSISMSEFPYPAYSGGKLTEMLKQLLPLIIIGSFCLILPNIIKRVVEEKETGVKELMKMMGLRPWMVWVGWLLNANMVNVFVTIIISVILTVPFGSQPAIIPYTNPVIIWLMLFLFMNAVTVYLFVFCAIFHRPLIASAVGMVCYFAPQFFLNTDTFQKLYSSLFTKVLVCLVPTVCVREGSNVIFAFNSRAIGIQFSNLFKSPTDDPNDISMGLILLMFLFDTLFYATLTWYIDCVRPGPYGRARPWYFILNLFGGRSDPKDLLLTEDDSVNNATFETPQQDLNVGISIRNLTKVFPPNVHAVNGVNIDIYKGQITALLGHNGAGKTTTMSILSGLYSPTTGTIHKHISNSKCYNVFENMSDFRQDLGLCPQHNMLFSYFTVIEHLLFFGMLKGLSIGEARYEGKKLLQTLNISDKANVRVDSLSGGMKRKLSLAVSLIGQPKVLILDEPTSGMDPESRREMWDILLSIRQDRTIIITTHFMEEADVLGDRIAIMDHGKVQCYGTSMFLKRIYGAGYNMTLLTKPQADIQQITNIVTEAVADSKLRAHHQGQLIYNLPTEKSSKFAFLFSKIESQKNELNVTSIGVSCTTMEDVFLKVGELSVLERERRNELDRTSNNSQYQFNNRVTSSTEHLSPKKISGLPLIVQQFCVLFVKKVRFAYRKVWGFLFFMVLSMLMLIVALHSGTLTETKIVPSFKLDLSQYPGSEVLTTYKNNPQVTSYLNYYKSVVTNSNSKITVTENGRLIDELIAEGEKNIQRFRLKMVAAAEWGVKGVTAFYSTIANHGPPISLNLITNSILKALTNNNNTSIGITNHPFSASILDPCIGGSIFNKLMVQTKWGITIPFGMLFIVASYINFPLTERLNGAKHLQLMTGLSPITYWASAYCWDIIMFICSSFLLLIPIFFFDELRMFGSCREIGVFFFIVNMYGVSGIPFAYFFSFFKGTPAGASSAFIFYNTIFGCAGAIVISVLNALQYLTGFWYTLVNGLLMLNPYYCVSLAMLHFSALAYQSSVCRVCTDPIFQPINNCDKLKKFSYIAFADDSNVDAVGEYLVFLGIDWIIYFGIILFIDYGYMGRCFNYIKKQFVRRNAEESLDIDVQEERDRVDAVRMNVDDVSAPGQVSGLGAPVLVVDGLMKKFGLKFTAVKGISFAVSSGECFGLLGVNGAGKTTTFKMLTGDEIPTAGTAKILKYSLTRDRAKYLKQIGYCPQFDAINEMMTGMEMLDIFGKLRGLTPGETQHQADYWIDLLGLDEYKDRLCGTYSGGNKRKLSTAMSLIGDPVIVFLDEPTSGVDPVARRRLWNVLAKCQKGGQSIVLTSHSMDECEALCNRLTIMVKGQMVCIGNIQYLKQRFGQGFTIMVKIRSVEHPEEHLDELKRHIEQKFAPGCILKDEHKGLLHYHVTDTTKPWSLLFQSMDDIKRKFELVEDYVVSETTLEQVFISFAKQQKED